MREWRKLHSGIVHSSKIAQVSDGAAYLFTLLVVAQDDEGRYPLTSTKLRALTPARPWTEKQTRAFLRQLADATLVELSDARVTVVDGPAKNGRPWGHRDTFLYDNSAQTVPELKSQHGWATKPQKRWIALLQSIPGIESEIWRPSLADGVRELLCGNL